MSWDIYVMDLPKDVLEVKDIALDFVPQPLGTKNDIIAKIQEVVPTVDFTDTSWGRIEVTDFSIEINLGRDETVESFALKVRGKSVAIEVIATILNHLGLRAYDPSSKSGFFEREEAVRSFEKWRAYRDCVIE